MDGLLELGILPLGAVLFPGVRRPLRLAAEHDRLLVGHCLEQDEPLGAVLAPGSGEIDCAGLPQRTGTLARVIGAAPRPDGPLVATLLGLGRCRVLEVSQLRPFAKGKLELVKDDPGDPDGCRRLAAKVVTALVEYLAALLALANRPASEITLPTDSLSLSYAVAASLPVSELERQCLLEASSVARRLHRTLAILERERSLLSKQITCRQWSRLALEQRSPN